MYGCTYGTYNFKLPSTFVVHSFVTQTVDDLINSFIVYVFDRLPPILITLLPADHVTVTSSRHSSTRYYYSLIYYLCRILYLNFGSRPLRLSTGNYSYIRAVK